MGTYLATGVVSHIKVSKGNRVDIDRLILAISKKVNLERFDFTEHENHYIWEIKNSTLENSLLPFISEQLKYYDQPESIDFFNKMKGMSGEDIKNFIIKCKNEYVKDSHCFQLLENFYDTEYLDDARSYSTDVQYSMFCFFVDGKIIMECYNNILHYFEQLIRLQKDKYPIADCVRVMITY